MWKRGTRKVCLLVAIGGLLVFSLPAFAGVDEVIAAADAGKAQVEAGRDALFGASGSLQWLMQGIAGPVGAPTHNSTVTISDPSAVLDATTYVSVENAPLPLFAAVSLVPSVESFEMHGYVHAAADEEIMPGSVFSFGILGYNQNVGNDGDDFESVEVIRNSGIVYDTASADNLNVNSAGIALLIVPQAQGGGTVDAQGDFINSGTVYTTASTAAGDASSIGLAFTMYPSSEGGGNATSQGNLINSGAVYTTTTAGEGGEAKSYGLKFGTHSNAAAGGTSFVQDDLSNSGTVYVTASGESLAWSVGLDADTYAQSQDGGNAESGGTFKNSGTIFVQARGEHEALADGMSSHRVANATGGGDAWILSSMSNAGSIYSDTEGGDSTEGFGWSTTGIVAHSDAYAKDGGRAVSGNMLTNKGTLYVTERGSNAEAYGMYSNLYAETEDGGIAYLFNYLDTSGTIYAQASGETARAAGILFEGSASAIGGGKVDIMNYIGNFGTIYAYAEGYSVAVYGIFSTIDTHTDDAGDVHVNRSELENSGTIYVQASGTDAVAAGIYTVGDTSIENSGVIYVDGAGASGIAVAGGDVSIFNPGFVYAQNGARTLNVSSGSATLEGDFSLVFTGDPTSSSYVAPIVLSTGSSLDLNGVTLVANSGDDLFWNSAYGIIENNGGAITNVFGGLELGVANPGVKVAWAGTDNAGNAAASFSYSPTASSAAVGAAASQQTIAGAMNLVQNRMTSLTLTSFLEPDAEAADVLLADSGTIVSDGGYCLPGKQRDPEQALFFKPYVTHVNQPSDGGMGYTSSTVGFIAGYDRMVSPSVLVGIHGGVGQADINYTGAGYDDNSEQTDIYSLGLHGAYTHENWHVQAWSSLYAARHDYEGLTGLNLDLNEEDTYTSYGSETGITGGYMFRFGRMAIMPEVGLAYSWMHGESHTSDADSSAWNTSYNSYDEHVIKSILGAHIMGTWELGGALVTPSLGVRWEQALNDNTIGVSQSLPGTSSVRVTDNLADTSILTDASLKLSKDNVSMELGLVQEYNDDYTATGGSITFRWAF